MGVLDLRTSARTKVFRHTVEYMQADEQLKNVIQTWVVWDGSKVIPSNRPDLSSMVPILRLEPTLGTMGWYSPASQAGDLIVRIRTVIKSWDADDYLNLWEAIENSLYPYGEHSRIDLIQQELRDRGATTGQWTFQMPAAAPDHVDEDGMFACDGLMKLQVERRFNP